MDAKLAQIYGTNQTDEADVEKLAAAELAAALSDDEELNLDGVDEEKLEALAAEVIGDGAQAEDDESEDEAAVEEDGEETEKVAEADFEQADQFGRIMAHAYVHELRAIEAAADETEKTAAKKGGKPPSSVKERIAAGAKKAGNAIEKGERKAEKAVGKGAKFLAGKVSQGAKAVAGSKAGKAVAKGGGKVLKHLAKNRGKYMLAGAAAGAAGAAAKRKTASAIDTLAAQRAEEIKAELGVEAEDNRYDMLAAEVEERALSLLADEGIEVESVEEPTEE